MQKTLQEIQAENRRLILEAVHGCSYEQAVSKELTKVLLALADWIDDDGMYMTANKNLRFENIIWDLTKETLEDQSEETQRAINQLLTQ